MVVLGGLKPPRLSSSGSGEAGAPEEDRSDVHGRDSLAEEMSRILCLWCLFNVVGSHRCSALLIA